MCLEKRNPFLNTKVPLNEGGNDLNNQLSLDNFRMTVRKLHDCGWKNSSHKSADVAMLGYGCGVSVYPQFYDKKKLSFHMLPRPYIRSFDGKCSDLILKKEWVLNLAKRAETFVLEKIDLMRMSEVSTDGNTKKLFKSILVNFEAYHGEGK